MDIWFWVTCIKPSRTALAARRSKVWTENRKGGSRTSRRRAVKSKLGICGATVVLIADVLPHRYRYAGRRSALRWRKVLAVSGRQLDRKAHSCSPRPRTDMRLCIPMPLGPPIQLRPVTDFGVCVYVCWKIACSGQGARAGGAHGPPVMLNRV